MKFLVCAALIALCIISGCVGQKKEIQPEIDTLSFVNAINGLVETLQDTNERLNGLADASQDAEAGVIMNSCEAAFTENHLVGLTNVASAKPARQVDFYDNNSVSQLTDGDKRCKWPFLAHTTNLNPHPWMTVDLGEVYEVAIVTLYNRLECCDDRSEQLEVYLGEQEDHMQKYFYNENQIGPRCNFRLRNTVSARYVKVALAKKQYLHLCEIEVYAAEQ